MDQPIQQRMIRAAKLDLELYEEVEADASTIGQATTVVVLSAVAAGIGNLGQGGVSGLGLSVVAALVGWYIWAYLTYFIGTRLLPEEQTEADHGQLLRTLGFASAPGMLRIFGVVPGIGQLFFPISAVWMLFATVIAVRQALDYSSTLRAIGVCIIGWVIYAMITFIPTMLLGAG